MCLSTLIHTGPIFPGSALSIPGLTSRMRWTIVKRLAMNAFARPSAQLYTYLGSLGLKPGHTHNEQSPKHHSPQQWGSTLAGLD